MDIYFPILLPLHIPKSFPQQVKRNKLQCYRPRELEDSLNQELLQ